MAIATATLFATVLSLCISTDNSDTCNAYITDVAVTTSDCQANLKGQAIEMKSVWLDDRKLTPFLKKFHIVEDVKFLETYEYSCQPLPESEIP